jgi:hypothetical protein
MKSRIAVGAFALTVLAFAGAVAGEGLKSGLSVGESCSPFHPLNLTGPDEGKKQCLV